MKIAIHQPQYWPGLRFFSKMRACDLFVYLDDVQYERREFQNRNRLRTPEGWMYLTLPVRVKGKYSQKINEVELNPTGNWRTEHLRAIESNYGRAPFFGEYAGAIRALYAGERGRLLDAALATSEFMRPALGITVKTVMSSELGVETASTRRLVDICLALGADTYLSGSGARAYLDASLFEQAGIKIEYQDFKVRDYPQAFPGFEPDMSALDLLLNLGPAAAGFL